MAWNPRISPAIAFISGAASELASAKATTKRFDMARWHRKQTGIALGLKRGSEADDPAPEAQQCRARWSAATCPCTAAVLPRVLDRPLSAKKDQRGALARARRPRLPAASIRMGPYGRTAVGRGGTRGRGALRAARSRSCFGEGRRAGASSRWHRAGSANALTVDGD
jgi:hypothetical protein